MGQKDKEIEVFKKTLQKQFEDTKFISGEELPPVVPNFTGSLRLDIMLHGPFFEGSLVELFGQSGSGKTTLALSILNEATSNPSKKLLYIDQEMRLRDTLLSTFPALKGRLEIVQAPNGTQALKIVELWVRQFPGSIVVVDSVDSLIPESVSDNDIGDAAVGGLSRLMSDACRHLTRACAMTNSTVIFLNQIRSKIGGYGNPETTSGGNALLFYASQRIQLMPIVKDGRILDATGKHAIGHRARFKVVKNSVTVPFVEGDFPLIYGKGIDKVDELVDLACDLDVLHQDGTYILMDEGGTQKKRPPKTVKEMMRADPALYEKVLAEVKALYPDIFSVKAVAQTNVKDAVKIDE